MRLTSLALCALLTLGLAAPGLAQSGPTTGFDAPRPAPAPAPQPEPEPQPVPQPQTPPEDLGPEQVRDTFGDWELRCFGDSDECFIFQIATNDQGRPAAEMVIVTLDGPQAAAGITLTLPLGVVIPEGVVLRVDTGRAQQFGYSFCIENGCVARFGVGEGLVNSMKAGANLRLIVSAVNVPVNPIELTISLQGFTAAYDAIPG